MTLLASFFLPSHLSFKNMYGSSVSVSVSELCVVQIHVYCSDYCKIWRGTMYYAAWAGVALVYAGPVSVSEL